PFVDHNVSQLSFSFFQSKRPFSRAITSRACLRCTASRWDTIASMVMSLNGVKRWKRAAAVWSPLRTAFNKTDAWIRYYDRGSWGEDITLSPARSGPQSASGPRKKGSKHSIYGEGSDVVFRGYRRLPRYLSP